MSKFYEVIYWADLDGFEASVQDAIDRGWKLAGGIATSPNGFYQAMTLDLASDRTLEAYRSKSDERRSCQPK